MNMQAKQLIFDLGHRTAKGREDFLISPSNSEAVAMIDKWPDWPAPALILHGASASGKSHLASVWSEKSAAYGITADEFMNNNANEWAKKYKHIYILRADLLIGDRKAETNLFHLYNIFKEEGRSMLLTMRATPSILGFEVADLGSRLRAAPFVTIYPPDDFLLSSLLVKLFSDRQIQVSEDVINYTLPRMERSFSAARDIVDMADKMALEKQKAISVHLMREVLQRL